MHTVDEEGWRCSAGMTSLCDTLISLIRPALIGDKVFHIDFHSTVQDLMPGAVIESSAASEVAKD